MSSVYLTIFGFLWPLVSFIASPKASEWENKRLATAIQKFAKVLIVFYGVSQMVVFAEGFVDLAYLPESALRFRGCGITSLILEEGLTLRCNSGLIDRPVQLREKRLIQFPRLKLQK